MHTHVVAKAVGQLTREPIIKDIRETYENIRNVENTHIYFTIALEELQYSTKS